MLAAHARQRLRARSLGDILVKSRGRPIGLFTLNRCFFALIGLSWLPVARALADAAPAAMRDAPPAVGEVIKDTFAWREPGGAALCFEPLKCKVDGCSKFEDHMTELKKLVAKKAKGVSLNCEYAEHGTCGTWTYIYCDQGEASGMRLRLFDDTGHLAAVRAVSDYEEFCGGTTRTTYMGQIPACKPLERTGVIIGKGQTPTAPALDGLTAKKPVKK